MCCVLSLNTVICLALILSVAQEKNNVANYLYVEENNVKDVFSIPGRVYIINSTIDLKGEEIIIPNNSTLKFKRNGRIVNGSIVGKDTKMLGLRAACLGVTIKGTWLVSTIRDSFFDYSFLSDNEVLDNVLALQSSAIRNKIILTKPSYRVVLDDYRKRGLQLKDNAILNMQTTIYLAGNNLSRYAILVVGNNNKIIGGEIVGDIDSHVFAEGTTSEWGFGIYLNMVDRVSIIGTRISKCIGDGIYLGGGTSNEMGDFSSACRNVVITNVVSDNNRRQGISITCADNVLIKNCTFSNTGKTEMISPGCGIDIEPNKGQSVRRIIVKNSRILNNNKLLDASIGGYESIGSKCNVENILFENCEVTGALCICTGSVTLKHCTLSTLSLHLAKMPKEKVNLYDCTITGGSGIKIRSVGNTTDSINSPVYSFKSCTIGMDNVLTSALFSIINHKGNEVADFNFENCKIHLPRGERQFEMIQHKTTCSFRFKGCSINSQGRSINYDNKMFEKCVFYK